VFELTASEALFKTFSQVLHSSECECNNHLKHESQFSVLRILNDCRENGQFLQQDTITFVDQEIFSNEHERV